MRNFSLAFLTLQDVSPIEAIEIAHQVGSSHVGLRLLPAIPGEFIYPLVTDKGLRSEVKQALQDNDVKLGDVELIRLKPDTNITDFDDFFSCAQDLGVQNVTVVSDDPSLERFTSTFAALCKRAKPYGLCMNLEPIPWTKLNSYHDVCKVINDISHSNAGVLIDTYHFDRLNTSFDIFNDINPALMQVFQVSDAPKQFKSDNNYIRNEARTARLIPGDGQLPLTEFIPYIPESTIISIEVPNQKMIEEYSPLRRAEMAIHATKKLFKES